MDCEEAVYSNDYYDFIVDYSQQRRESAINVCQQTISQYFSIKYLPRSESLPLNIVNYSYTSIQ